MTTLAFSSAGSKVSLSAGVPATVDSAGFGALTYTEIKELTDIGMIGPESAVITHNPVGDNTTYKLKGSRNSGSLDLKGARAPTDAGQTLLIAAEASTAPYAVKIVLQSGTILYAQVLVMSYKTSIGTVSQITSFESKCEVSGPVVTA
jgi:hypothetical protein|tara:strand:+ start:131 stop:574 length:444 start_codon:yes stop_codon:yes gene_type:complete